MELRWLIEVSVMGFLLMVVTSQKYPQPKSTSYPNERVPPANGYNSDRPITTTGDDYLPVAAIEPVYGTNYPRGNYNQYPNPARGSDNDSKYPAKDYHVPLSYCPEVGGLESHCRPAKDCTVWYNIVRTIPGTACTLENGQGGQGICCPNMPYNGRHGATFSKPSSCPQGLQPDPHPDRITKISVKEAVELGKLQMASMIGTEKRLVRNNIHVRPGSQRHTHSRVFFHSTPTAVRISNSSLYAVNTALHLVKRYQIKPEQVECVLNHLELKYTTIANTCPTFPDCDLKTFNSPFRTITGICNNIHPPGHVPWGVPRTQYQRALAPNYADGVWMPRRATNGGQLPHPRLLSNLLIRDLDVASDTDTTFVMQYGQFIDHDMLETMESKTADGASVPCCTDDGQFLDEGDLSHGKCIPIEIPQADPFYSMFRQRCMQFARSAPACRTDGRLGHVEQMNQNTHYLDHSGLYGSDDQLAGELRTFEKGALKVFVRPGKGCHHHDMDLHPPDNETDVDCALSKAITGVNPPPEIKCFKAGDDRINVTPYMVASQTVFLREHNGVAELLAELNPHWDDERLYQEARRILIAQMQHITYNEYLPVLIGREKMQELSLLPLQKGFSRDYDENVNPSILNEFAAAAFRFGHSLVPGKQDLINQQRVKERDILLRQHFFKTTETYTPGNLDKFLIALATIPSQRVDTYFTEEMTNHLFEEAGKGFGMDIVSLNIQRGRDHGLPGYNSYRELCGLPRARDFHDLLDVIPPKIVEKFESVYDTVDDIDLFIAGVSERPAKGAMVGPIFQCIIADQFLRLKRGDRYFYDLGGQAGSFTQEQLDEIRKISYSRIVCDNSFVQFIQPLFFKAESELNPIVSCMSFDSIPRMNIFPWKENGSADWRLQKY
ncbi:peroxidase-like [Daphnia pulicaria]|uniref:peroxidase-like n=1 Tax=Daphnia pulicaria TaxID=35523 RepID=UPI001EE9F621|nr:peroxidase-like [Daphnia pulicaria]XP_046639002.1 peroxidase-like [Daphnia pulicaria]